MSSSLLDSFDPFATHPFTNGSGLVAQPPKPSQYPILIPSPHRPSPFSQTYPKYQSDYASPSSVSSDSTMSSNSPTSPLYAPQPRRRPVDPSVNANLSSPSTSPTKPIFVPFRKETSSPELVLKKRAPTTKNASTQTPPGATTSQK